MTYSTFDSGIIVLITHINLFFNHQANLTVALLLATARRLIEAAAEVKK